MQKDEKNLDGAYALGSPEANRRFYDDWAGSYESGFVQERGYRIPGLIAKAFAALAGSEDTPVLDIGAGTGLVAEALAGLGDWQVDALDISLEMLRVAQAKGRYRNYLEADLSGRTPIEAASYGAAISSGTFTHGHLGPGGLDEVLRVVRPGGLVAITINEEHYAASGFGEKFTALQDKISQPRFSSARVYRNRVGDGHDDDTVLLTLFRKRD
ncbi:MAG: class I SAM-dependent DNA methyltransferase [Paracoccaceae bacterium]